MSSDNPKRQLFAMFADLARTLGNGHRLELVELLAQGEQPVEALAARTGLSFANTSQHLQQLRKRGLVESRRSGKNIVYSLADGPIVEMTTALRKLAEHNIAAVQQVVSTYFDHLDALEPIESAELMARLDAGGVVLLDVRPEDEFKAGHIPGAINVDQHTLSARLADLPRDTQIVAYCRGPYCILSFEIVNLLREQGFNVRRFSEGFPEWKASGRPVATA